jgi:hypothetical protein
MNNQIKSNQSEVKRREEKRGEMNEDDVQLHLLGAQNRSNRVIR